MEKALPLLPPAGSVRQVLDVVRQRIQEAREQIRDAETELQMWDMFWRRWAVAAQAQNYIAERSHELKITLNRTRGRLEHLQELYDSLPICTYCDGKGRTWQPIAEDPGQSRSIACPSCRETGER
jgi:hypothetical protein